MVELLQHNQETYQEIQQIFKTKNRACVVQPTGSGKSYLMLKLLEDYSDKKTLIIQPQRYIIEQFKSSMPWEMEKIDVQFLTYSKLSNLDNQEIESIKPDLILIDEMHRAGAKKWQTGVKKLLNTYPNAKTLGLSATPIRYLDGSRNMAEELFDGNMACDMSLSGSIIRRILPLPRYISALYTFDNEVAKTSTKIAQSHNSEEDKAKLLDQVAELKKRLDMASGVSVILRKYLTGISGKFIVFCRDINHLEEMRSVVKQWFLDAGFSDTKIYAVHSKNHSKDKDFKTFKEDNSDCIRLCLAVGMLNEGIHDIDGVILLRNTISPNLYYQQIGRALSCDGQLTPIIFDLVANGQSLEECNLKSDLAERIKREQSDNKDFIDDFNLDSFFVLDEVIDAVNQFKDIESRLIGGFEFGLQRLSEYTKEHGDALVPIGYVCSDGLALGRWVSARRKEYKNKVLSIHKIKELEKLEFCWSVQDIRFKEQMTQVICFAEKRRRTPNLRAKDAHERKLGVFLTIQKAEKKRRGDSYPQRRIELLESIEGFTWEFDSFKTFYDLLVGYKKENGHLNIKQEEEWGGYKIGDMLARWRKKYKNNQISKDEMEAFKKLGLNLENKNKMILRERLGIIETLANQEKKVKSNGEYSSLYYYIITSIKNNPEKLTQEERKNVEAVMGCKIAEMGSRSNSRSRKIEVFNDEGINVETYDSCMEAERKLSQRFDIKFNDSSIGRACTKNRQYKGFTFKYVNEDTPLETDGK
ncbi:Helicase associated domain protein [Robinsoniella sp. KNHs210]|uniref:Helicase associated domain protein n=1 Tax=Robinsoniella sp. KNHs210 TaxID=1469950 RepID=UPI000485DCE8|nr:Helicase associated domain protein [Robinsoniella sp. KNHs210]